MANRRMFARTVCCTDDFYDLSKDERLLYFSLGLEADDDGMVGSARMICKMADIPYDVLDMLEQRGYIKIFPKCVGIVHWKTNNTIRGDRRQPTVFPEELAEMEKSEKKSKTKKKTKGKASKTHTPEPLFEPVTDEKLNLYKLLNKEQKDYIKANFEPTPNMFEVDEVEEDPFNQAIKIARGDTDVI